MVYSTVYNYTKNASVCYHSADDVAGVLVLVLASTEAARTPLPSDPAVWTPKLVPGLDGTGMLSFWSASDRDESDEFSGVDVDAGFTLVLVFAFELEPALELELEAGGRMERRLSFSGEPGAAFATELAVGCAKLKEKDRRWWRGVSLLECEVEVDVDAAVVSDAGFAGVKPRRESALAENELDETGQRR